MGTVTALHLSDTKRRAVKTSKRKQHILSSGNNDCHAQVNVCHLLISSFVSINV